MGRVEINLKLAVLHLKTVVTAMTLCFDFYDSLEYVLPFVKNIERDLNYACAKVWPFQHETLHLVNLKLNTTPVGDSGY